MEVNKTTISKESESKMRTMPTGHEKFTMANDEQKIELQIHPVSDDGEKLKIVRELEKVTNTHEQEKITYLLPPSQSNINLLIPADIEKQEEPFTADTKSFKKQIGVPLIIKEKILENAPEPQMSMSDEASFKTVPEDPMGVLESPQFKGGEEIPEDAHEESSFKSLPRDPKDVVESPQFKSVGKSPEDNHQESSFKSLPVWDSVDDLESPEFKGDGESPEDADKNGDSLFQAKEEKPMSDKENTITGKIPILTGLLIYLAGVLTGMCLYHLALTTDWWSLMTSLKEYLIWLQNSSFMPTLILPVIIFLWFIIIMGIGLYPKNKMEQKDDTQKMELKDDTQVEFRMKERIKLSFTETVRRPKVQK